jgi:hypothetical protein
MSIFAVFFSEQVILVPLDIPRIDMGFSFRLRELFEIVNDFLMYIPPGICG